MLKGKAKIELTNIHTGEREVIEEENMFTKGLEYTLNALEQFPTAVNNTQNQAEANCMYPIIENLLGGVMLFSGKLEENEENIYPPTEKDGITMTGCANTSVNDVAEQKFRGSFNDNESGPNEDGGYTFVWDFATNQANGTIAALSLVPACAGINGINMDKSTLRHGYGMQRINKGQATSMPNNYYSIETIEYTVVNQEIWRKMLKNQKTAEGEKRITLGAEGDINFSYLIKGYDLGNNIIKMAHVEAKEGKLILFVYDLIFANNKVGLNDVRYQATSIDNITSVELTENGSGFFGQIESYDYFYVFGIDDDTYMVGRYYDYTEPTQSEDGKLGKSTHKIMMVDIKNKTVKEQQEKELPYMRDNSRRNTYVTYIKERKELLFGGCQKYENEIGEWKNLKYCLAVNVDNFSDKKEILVESDNDITMFNMPAVQIIKGRYSLYNGNIAEYYIDKGNQEVKEYNNISSDPLLGATNHNASALAEINGAIAYYINTYNDNTINISKSMIGTILMTVNNLESTVEKTADKTMKITYTVREVQEDE